MEIKNIKSMNIKDCMDRQFLRYETLKEIVSNNNNQESIQNAICQSLMDTSETTMAIMKRLSELLLLDKQAFMACQSPNDYQEYGSQFSDGLWKEEAEEMARKMEQQMKDTAFFNKKKDSIKGLQAYLNKYPNGIHARTAKELLQKKTKFAKICIIFLGLTILAAYFYNLVFADPSNLYAKNYIYQPVLYKMTGGEEKVEINNDSNKGLSVTCDNNWFSATVNSKIEITISCGQNDYEPQIGQVTVRCGGKTCEIIVKQQGWVDCKECDNGWIICKRCGGDGLMDCDNNSFYRSRNISYNNSFFEKFHGRLTYDYLGPRITPCPTCGGTDEIPCGNCKNGLVKCNKCSIENGGDGKGRVKSYNPI